MTVLYFLSLICVVTLGKELNHDEGYNLKEKRLLLHSELDVAAEFAKLTSRLDQQQILTNKLTDEVRHLTNQQSDEIRNITNKLTDEIRNITNKLTGEIRNLTGKLSEKENEVETLKTTVEQINKRKASGSTYTRWGKTTCPGNNTELVYKGYMGGTTYSSTGGGVNYLCLSEDPQWDHYDVSIQSQSVIKGVEYQFYNFRNQDGASAFFGKNIFNDDAPCAVCHSDRGASIMIPGRTECYSGWTKEYSGYIVGEHDAAPHPSEWICLDRRPDTVVGGKTDDDEGLLHVVEASCGGSLECPPYIQGREITCVVCTK